MRSTASPTVLSLGMSSLLSSTPYSSWTIWPSSTRSSESTSSASKVASRVTSSGSGPKEATASMTRASICWGVACCVDMLISFEGVSPFDHRRSGDLPATLRLGGQTAVDGQNGAGDVPGVGGSEEGDRRGDLLGAAGPAGGDGGE